MTVTISLKLLQRLIDNNTTRQRMGRELLRRVQSAIEGVPRQPHERSTIHQTSSDDHVILSELGEIESNMDEGDDPDIVRLDRAVKKGWQLAVKFKVDTLFNTSSFPSEGTVECIMFDYLSIAKPMHEARETFSEYFPF